MHRLELVQIDAQQDGSGRRAPHRLRCVLVWSFVAELSSVAGMENPEFGTRGANTAQLFAVGFSFSVAFCCAAGYDTALAAAPPRVSLSMMPSCAGVYAAVGEVLWRCLESTQ